MGAIGGMLGLSGGANGTGFATPTGANIVNPTNQTQINQAYNGTQDSLASQQALLAALQGQNGLGNQSQVYNQLQGVASGAVNPAQAQFNQNTAANVANQAALMAGQRGASSNVGLIARQAAQQGGALQQQAAGQEATQQAQNQINAIGQAGQLATTQAGQQIGQTNALTQAQQAQQNALLAAQQGVNQANVSSQASINTGNTQLANTEMGAQQQMFGGAAQGASALGGLAGGGGAAAAPATAAAGPSLGANYGLLGTAAAFAGGGAVQGPQSALGQLMLGAKPMAAGGKVDVLLSPGEVKLTPAQVEQVKKGANPLHVGTVVPGKPKVGGAVNSYANDIVPEKAAPGTIIVPRKETKSKDPEKNSADFVAKTLAKRKASK